MKRVHLLGAKTAPTRRQAAASAADIFLLHRIISEAAVLPMAAGKSSALANSGARPERAKGVQKVAAEEEYTASHSSSKVTPTPTAGPCTQAITGTLHSMSDLKKRDTGKAITSHGVSNCPMTSS